MSQKKAQYCGGCGYYIKHLFNIYLIINLSPFIIILMWKKLHLFSRNKQTNKQTKTPHKKLYITVNKNDFNRSLMFV